MSHVAAPSPIRRIRIWSCARCIQGALCSCEIQPSPKWRVKFETRSPQLWLLYRNVNFTFYLWFMRERRQSRHLLRLNVTLSPLILDVRFTRIYRVQCASLLAVRYRQINQSWFFLRPKVTTLGDVSVASHTVAESTNIDFSCRSRSQHHWIILQLAHAISAFTHIQMSEKLHATTFMGPTRVSPLNANFLF